MNLQALGALLQDALWADLAEAKRMDEAPLLAHYTTIDTFEKIVKSGEMWLSNPLFMNDLEEMRFGMMRGADFFRGSSHILEACADSERLNALMSMFDEEWSNFEQRHALDTYVLCFSAHEPDDVDGRLSMWRGYGAQGRGVAMVFNPKSIPRVEGSPLIAGPVTYMATSERIQWFESKVQAPARLLALVQRTDDELRLVVRHWLARLQDLRSVYEAPRLQGGRRVACGVYARSRYRQAV
ncbi:MAG: DUF2971 domain-containing protein [Alcaligenaceae bacterium]|nr:MAG: DUF2971 domain-containing protein [Alcaligenaceae bacterium]